MTTESDTVVDSVEIICEPGVSRKWLLQMSQVASTKLTAESTSSRAVVPTILAVEHEIAATIEEQGDAVARVVHSFCGRDVHLRDGSRIEYRWELIGCDWRCLDCGVNTDAIDEYYMLNSDLWAVVNPDITGNLCIGCVESRLGRALTPADFTDGQINDPAKFRRSARLCDRLGAQKPL